MKVLRQRYDYALIVATALVLALIGVVCIYGVLYSYAAYESNSAWTQTPQRAQYLDMMNNLAFPLVVALLLLLGLCIPKRILSDNLLMRGSLGIILGTMAFWVTLGLRASLAFVLIASIAFQGVVVYHTIRQTGHAIYQREGYLVQIGSGLIHLGTAMFLLTAAVLNQTPVHIPLFWAATLLMGAGIIVSFYPDRILSIIPQ